MLCTYMSKKYSLEKHENDQKWLVVVLIYIIWNTVLSNEFRSYCDLPSKDEC